MSLGGHRGPCMGNRQDPVRRVGSWMLCPDRASGVAAYMSISLENPPSYGVLKDCNIFYLNRTVGWRSPRRMTVQSHWCVRDGSSLKLEHKPRP